MKKKIGIIIAILVVAILIGTILFIIQAKQNEEKAKQVLQDFIALINEKNYEAMYEKVASMNKSKEDFIQRNQNIYEGIKSSDIKIEITEIKKQNQRYQISYHQKMYTAAGEIEFDHVCYVQKEEKEFKLEWESNFIFPELSENDKVRISTIKAKRGSIVDRKGVILAEDGNIASVGIVPGKLGEKKQESIAKISELTGVSTDYIKEQLEASYVKEDTFVPVKKVVDSDTQLKEALLQIPGVMINKEAGRVYPLGKETSHLIRIRAIH